MRWTWLFGLALVVVALVGVALWWVGAWRQRRRHARLDLELDDLSLPPPELKRRRGEFVDDTAPAVLSVPPELERPEWEQQRKRR